MDISKIFLSCSRASIAAILLAGLVTGSVTASPTNTTRSVEVHKADPNRPATRLEIITAVKKAYPGRILSIRKSYKAFGVDCHTVKLIDKKGELLSINVNCD